MSNSNAQVPANNGVARLRRARRLLEIAQQLMETSEPAVPVPVQNPASSSSMPSPSRESPTSGGTTTSTQAAARVTNHSAPSNQELRTLFSFSSTRREQSRPTWPKSKRRKIVQSGAQQKQNPWSPAPGCTWTHRFCCLSDCDAINVPSVIERDELQRMGLGTKKVKFDRDGNYEHLKETLCLSFPKLKDGGGFLLFRASAENSKTLTQLTMPSSGYSVPYLRDESNLRQALAYIRPLQKNLDKDTDPMKDSETVVKVPCVYCAQEVAVTEVTNHHKSCVEKSGDKNDHSSSEDDLSDEDTNSTIPDLKVTEVTNHHKSCVEKSEDKNDHYSSEDDLSDELDTNSILSDLKLDGKVNNLLDILGESIPRGDILKALKECNGDADKAFFELTGEKDHDDNDPVIVDDSLPSTSATSIVDNDPSMNGDSLHEWRSRNVQNGRPPVIYYNRDSNTPFRQLVGFYKSGMNLNIRPALSFISGGEEELAVDAGGPTREYFYLIMNTILSNTEEPLFEGQQKHLVPVVKQVVIQQELFELVGKILNHSILHGGCGLTGLALPIRDYILAGDVDRAAGKIVLEDVADLELREMLQKVLSAKEEELEDLGKSMIDVLAFSGASHYDVNINNRGILVYEVMLHHVLLSRKIQLDQLRRGLNSMGLLKAVQNDDKLATVLFPDEGQICFDLLKPKVMLKEDESMETEAKKRAFDFFLTYLEEKCNTQGGETTIYDVLQFVTGYRDVPHKISIKFSPTEAQKLPDPGTCTEELILPIGHGNYSEFMKSFDVTISCQGTGFGRY